jgi:NAD(P)-dependent dehydrogenase (short-subunit alcohol dehydrogenase family)
MRPGQAFLANSLFSGSISTPLMDKRNVIVGDESIQPVPINRAGTSEEVGNIIVWLLSDEATYVSGATYAVDGGWAC